MRRMVEPVSRKSSKLLAKLMALQILACWLGGCTTVDHDKLCDDLVFQAGKAHDAGNYNEVAKLLGEAERESKVAEDPSRHPRVLRETAELYIKEGKAHEAEQITRDLLKYYADYQLTGLKHFQIDRIVEDRNRAKIVLADALVAQKQFEAAVKVLDEASADATKNSNDFLIYSTIRERRYNVLKLSGKTEHDREDEAFAKMNTDLDSSQGNKYMSQKEFGKAIESYKKACVLADHSTDVERRVDAYTDLAQAEHFWGKNVDAFANVSKAVKLASSDRAVAPKVRATAYALQSFTNPARAAAVQNLKDAAKVSSLVAYSFVENMCWKEASVPAACGLYPVDLGWEIAPNLEAKERMNLLRLIAVAVGQQAKTGKKETVKDLSWLFRLSRSADLSTEEKIFCLEGCAQMTRDTNAVEAVKLYRQAISIRSQLKQNQVVNVSLNAYRLGTDYLLVGEYDLAIKAATAGLVPNDLPVQRGSLLEVIGDAESKKKQFASASSNYEEAIKFFNAARQTDCVRRVDTKLKYCKKRLHLKAKIQS